VNVAAASGTLAPQPRSVESHSGGRSKALAEVLEGGWPWLPLVGPFAQAGPGLAAAGERAGRLEAVGLAWPPPGLVVCRSKAMLALVPSLLLWPPFLPASAPPGSRLRFSPWKVTGFCVVLPCLTGLLGLGSFWPLRC